MFFKRKPSSIPSETHHQQCLAKNPRGYCGLQNTGVPCPTGAGVVA